MAFRALIGAPSFSNEGGARRFCGEFVLPIAIQPAGMFVYVEDADETYHKALAEGAKSIMPPSDQEYGRSGGVIDPFGNTWWPTTGKG